MLPTFSVTVSTVHADPANQSFESYISPIAHASSLEAAFEHALTYHQTASFKAPASGIAERAIQIHEQSRLIAMATVSNERLQWMKSPTVSDAIEWSHSVKHNLERIEKQRLNTDCGQREQSFTFKVLVHLIDTAKDKLASLYQPRSNDEVYATLKKVEDRLLSRAKANPTNLFELSR